MMIFVDHWSPFDDPKMFDGHNNVKTYENHRKKNKKLLIIDG